MAIRLFVGLELPAEVAARLTLMGSGIPGARWVAAHNLHITLRFIGEVEEGLGEDIHEVLASLADPAFAVTLEGLGTFGSRRQARALWVGVERSSALAHLQGKVETAVVRLGLAPEPRKFTPHVTLAWLKNAPLQRIQDFIAGNSPFRAGPVAVEHFVLFRSHLSRNGAEYEAVARYPLGA
jgi:2'-5' RNA ligase